MSATFAFQPVLLLVLLLCFFLCLCPISIFHLLSWFPEFPFRRPPRHSLLETLAIAKIWIIQRTISVWFRAVIFFCYLFPAWPGPHTFDVFHFHACCSPPGRQIGAVINANELTKVVHLALCLYPWFDMRINVKFRRGLRICPTGQIGCRKRYHIFNNAE